MTEEHPGKGMGRRMMTLAWLLALGFLSIAFNHWLENRYNPNQDPASSANSQFREVILASNPQHHYIANGYINEVPVTFILDTGATDVAIPSQLARKLRLKPGASSMAITANGLVEVRNTIIDSLKLGNIELKSVRANLNPGMNGQTILLGMSALKQVEFTQRGDTLTLRQYVQ